jgi:N utilization substance protein A
VVESAADALAKLQGDAELAAALPAAVENIPQVQEVLAKKAENRPVTPEEYSLIAQFVDRVERRTIQIKEEAARVEEERVSAARAEIPEVAFSMPLEGLGVREHVYNILVEAGYETIGDLMLALKLDENKVLGLAGVGPKAIENMHDRLAVTEFPELPVEAPVESTTEEASAIPAEAAIAGEVPAGEAIEVAEAAAMPEIVAEPVLGGAKPRGADEEIEAENAKDGVSLDELFKLKPEIFRTSTPEEDEAEKAKGKKKKKKAVELVLDEELGEVVGRKKHKRGEDDLGVDE